MHDIPLVSTIAIGLGAAFLCGFVATKLRLSPLVGYLIAGIIVGPHSPGFVADIKIAEQLSEIGVVLLLFGVGLHFSVSDFLEVKKVAAVGAIARTALITAIGIYIGSVFGWSMGTGLLFGLCLSVASTVVMLRALEDHHLLPTITGKISVGLAVVEDVMMVLAMVMIPAVVAGTSPDTGSGVGTQLLLAFGKIGLFAAIMVIVGKRVLPWLLTAVARTGSRELFTLDAISMAMGIAFGAAMLFGVSLALGAFFAGMMIRESDLNHEVADRVLPFQDAFAVLFFVAVGMLFDPSVLLDSPLAVIAVVFVIVVVKALITFIAVRAFGYPRKTSLLIAGGLAQIGELSFILIAIGTFLGVMPEEARNLILAGALISIALNPILFRATREWAIRRGLTQEQTTDDTLAHLETGEKTALKNLIVLIGAGNTGRHIITALSMAENDLVILDENREKVEKLRSRGFHAIAGNAMESESLIEAGIDKAHAVMITVPDPFESVRIVELIESINPSARVFVRSRNDEETKLFDSKMVEMTVSATEEVARRMISGLQR